MLERYTRENMQQIWSLQNQYQTWLDVEIAVTAGWSSIGVVPETDLAKIRQNIKFDVDKIAELELETKHDVVAFTRNLSESLGDEKKWIHYGLTSTDVVDTAQSIRLRQANKIILDDLKIFADTLATIAKKYKHTIMVGRTHGVQAEPTTFGLKMARFYSTAKRNIDRFARVSKALEVGKLSGAVGTFANIPPEVEAVAMKELNLTPQDIASQVLPRDLHADYLLTIGLIGSTLEEITTEIRSLQRSEIREVEENFAAGQKGSSAMPHKRNPIGSENITGLARVLRGYLTPALEDISLWHERDISHSSVERIVLPDATSLLDYMLNRLNDIVSNLGVFEDTMLNNMSKTYNLIYSQRVLLNLIDSGMSRESAYDLVQPITAIAWDQKTDFIQLVKESEIADKLSSDQLNDIFDPNFFLNYVDEIFKRVGL